MIETDRLRLRRWRETDLAPFAALNADFLAMRYMPKPLTRAESDAWVARIEAEFERDGFGNWAVALREGDRFIGLTGLNWYPFEADFAPAVEIGWRFAPEFWGRGYATEAAAAALEAGFSRFGLHRIVAETSRTNWPSRNVMTRIGMKHDPEFDFLHPKMQGHALAPHVLYRIERGEALV